jgi:hypothetical protein
VITPDKAGLYPGPVPVLWAPSLAGADVLPWRPGFAVWHRSWQVWVPMTPDSGSPLGRRPPDDAILLVPEHPPAAADLAARIDDLEQALERLLGPGHGQQSA